jgi:hypothetical protein
MIGSPAPSSCTAEWRKFVLYQGSVPHILRSNPQCGLLATVPAELLSSLNFDNWRTLAVFRVRKQSGV